MKISELFEGCDLSECDRIIQDILDHRIVKSLAGSDDLSQAALIEISKNFYIQDYYFLTYGYNLANSYCIDINSERKNEEIVRAFGSHRNPFTSTSISRLTEIINYRKISISAGANSTTQKYIIFEIEKAFAGTVDLSFTRLACSAVFDSIGAILSSNGSSYSEDECLGDWVSIYIESVRGNYLNKQMKLCYQLITDASNNDIQVLLETFRLGCEYELSFLNSLIYE